MSTRKPKTAKAKAKKNTTKARPALIASPVDKRGRGRPTAYKPEYAEKVFKLCLLGAIDDEIADFFEVAVATINNWKHQHPDFLDAMRRGKTEADAEVAHSLYKKATGYSYETERLVGKGDDKKVAKLTVHVEADTTAAQFWVKNRKSAVWNDHKQVEVGSPGSFDNMDQKELLDYIRAEQEAIGLFEAEAGSDSIN
jgi:hypothetical protein